MQEGNFWKGKKVLVTGAAGFIGSWVVEKFLSEGALIRAFVRKRENKNLPEGVEVFEGDLENVDSVHEASNDCDAIFHLAALKRNMSFHEAHPASVLSTNLQMTLNVLKVAREKKISRVVLLGSARADDAWLNSPHFGYAWSKKIGEVLAEAYRKEYGINVTSVRVENTFGPKDVFDKELAQVVPALISRAVGGENPFRVRSNPEEVKNFSYVEDVAEALVAIGADNGAPSIVALAPSYILPFGELVAEIVKSTGVTTSVEFPDAQSGSNFLQEKKIDVSIISVTPKYTLTEALKKTLDWYKS